MVKTTMLDNITSEQLFIFVSLCSLLLLPIVLALIKDTKNILLILLYIIHLSGLVFITFKVMLDCNALNINSSKLNNIGLIKNNYNMHIMLVVSSLSLVLSIALAFTLPFKYGILIILNMLLQLVCLIIVIYKHDTKKSKEGFMMRGGLRLMPEEYSLSEVMPIQDNLITSSDNNTEKFIAHSLPLWVAK